VTRPIPPSKTGGNSGGWSNGKRHIGESVGSAEVEGVRRQSVFNQATFIHNVLFVFIGAIYASFIVVYSLVVFSSSAKSASDQLTRSVVVRALAERGFVPGRMIEFDRSYLLERVSTTALGDGEFIIRFKAKPAQ
jgi:hypothetical protein